MKKVLAFGTFDHFHAGHESYLKQAQELGSYLIVVVARDETVKKIKGDFPDQTEKERQAAIKKMRIADKVVIGNSTDKYEVIKKFKPDVIALGYDQFAFTFKLRKYLIDHRYSSKIVRLKSYKPEVFKSSLLKKIATGDDGENTNGQPYETALILNPIAQEL